MNDNYREAVKRRRDLIEKTQGREMTATEAAELKRLEEWLDDEYQRYVARRA